MQRLQQTKFGEDPEPRIELVDGGHLSARLGDLHAAQAMFGGVSSR